MKRLSPAASAVLCALVANAIFGFSFIFTKVALGQAAPLALLSWRFFLAFLVCTLIVIIGRIKISMRGRPWPLLLLLGVFHPILYFLGETYGLLYTSATFSAVMIALIPVVSIWASALVLKEAPTLRQSFFCCLSVLGVIVITANTTGGSNQLRGVLLLLLAVFSDVSFNLLTRKLSVSFTAFERTYVMFIMGSVVFFVLNLINSGGSLEPLLAVTRNRSLWGPLLYLGILSSVLAFFLINYASTLMPVTRTIVFVNVTTLVSVLAGVFLLKEPISPISVCAIGVIILGIWGVQRYARQDAPHPPALLEEEP